METRTPPEGGGRTTLIAAHEAAGWPVVYLDESGFAMDMPRPHGSAPRGRGTAIGARLAEALCGVGLTTSNVDADIFNLWLERDLIPKRPTGAVLVMDTATFHRRADTIEIIARAGHSL